MNHYLADFLYWLVFLAGQCAWVFICAAGAIRSKKNPLKSRREYVDLNWDILAIRMLIFETPIFLIWRYVGMNDIFSFFQLDWRMPFTGSGGPIAAFFIGLGSDSLLNAASKSKKLPEWLTRWIQEKAPSVPEEVVAVVKTETTVTPTAEGTPATHTTIETQITAPAPPPDK